jgi:hypothetical protein
MTTTNTLHRGEGPPHRADTRQPMSKSVDRTPSRAAGGSVGGGQARQPPPRPVCANSSTGRGYPHIFGATGRRHCHACGAAWGAVGPCAGRVAR